MEDGPKIAKDGFHRYIIDKETDAVRTSYGTKAAFWHHVKVDGGEVGELIKFLFSFYSLPTQAKPNT